MEPLVSVVVATYRRDTYLRKALDSLMTQTYPNFEIILVDDNDDPQWNQTVKNIVSGYFQYSRSVTITYIQNHPNQGSAKTRNIGISAARGEYVCFLDDDDQYLPEKIAKQVRFMAENGLDYSITDLDLYNENDRLVDRRVRNYVKNLSRDALTTYHLKYHLTGTDTMMFRKDYLNKIGGFPPIDVGDEYYLMHRAIDGGGKFGYLPTCDVKAYIHTGENGLSSGEGKILGEKALYQYKLQYFDRISRKDRRFVKMRHHAVIAFAQIRRKKYLSFMKNALISFCYSPMESLMLLKNRGRA